MSNYTTWIKHPVTGESVQANFFDDYTGQHKHRVVIVGSADYDPVYRAEEVEIDVEKIKEEENLIEELAKTEALSHKTNVKKNLYKLFLIPKGEYGKSFTMCEKCFEKWSKTKEVKTGNFIVKKVAERSLEPCNECGI